MASSSRLPLSLLAALLLLPFFARAEGDLAEKKCSNVTAQYQSNETFAVKMLTELKSQAPQHNFAYAYQPNSGLYGLAWCRGDFSSDLCADCLAKAARKLVQLCSPETTASRLVFQDFCYLRIDTESFFPHLDMSFRRILFDKNKELIAEADRTKFWDSVGGLMGKLKDTIPKEKKWFGQKNASFEAEDSTIHGMGQCVKGIGRVSCTTCLAQVKKDMDSQCLYHRACEVFYESCFLQYITKKN